MKSPGGAAHLAPLCWNHIEYLAEIKLLDLLIIVSTKNNKK